MVYVEKKGPDRNVKEYLQRKPISPTRILFILAKGEIGACHLHAYTFHPRPTFSLSISRHGQIVSSSISKKEDQKEEAEKLSPLQILLFYSWHLSSPPQSFFGGFGGHESLIVPGHASFTARNRLNETFDDFCSYLSRSRSRRGST